jgi:drug/metabolite transporter (DMT)-like permease
VQPAESYFYVFLVAMCTSFLASVLLKKGIGLIGSAKAGFLCLAEPVLSMIFGIVFLHEPFLINKALGCIVIVWSILTSFKRRA